MIIAAKSSTRKGVYLVQRGAKVDVKEMCVEVAMDVEGSSTEMPLYSRLKMGYWEDPGKVSDEVLGKVRQVTGYV